MDEKVRAADFLRDQGMDPGQIDLAELGERFRAEMERGLSGQTSSLAMFPSYISPPAMIPADVPVLAIDAGGTHFRAATVHFNRAGQPVIEDFCQLAMPGTDGEISCGDFFTAMADAVKELAGKCPRIGFCFSYPVEILPEKDGRLIRLAKEVQVAGISGQMIGGSLLQALQSRGIGSDSKILLLNDTVAALLAGMSLGQPVNASAHLGLILGTGSNTSYLEQGSRIRKSPNWPRSQPMIINVESGAFDQAPRGLVDREFDARLKDPGCFQLEKMIAGKYLGSLFLAVVKKAAAGGLFSAEYTASLAGLKRVWQMPTADLNRILLAVPQGDWPEILSGADPDDRRLAAALAELLVERAGNLTAAVLAALVLKTGCGQDPCRPVTITAEGSTFYRLHGLKPQIIRQMSAYLTEQRGLHFRFAQVDNAVLVGSAIAALTL